MKRRFWLMWLATVDAIVNRLDRMLATEPDDALWVPEARPETTWAWGDE